MAKADIVAEAVKAFAKSDYKAIANKNASTGSDKEVSSIKKTLNLLLEDYFIEFHEWDEKMINKKITILRSHKKSYAQMMLKSFYDGLNKKHQDELYSYRGLRLFLTCNAGKFQKQ